VWRPERSSAASGCGPLLHRFIALSEDEFREGGEVAICEAYGFRNVESYITAIWQSCGDVPSDDRTFGRCAEIGRMPSVLGLESSTLSTLALIKAKKLSPLFGVG
jgi:hypothetical protein